MMHNGWISLKNSLINVSILLNCVLISQCISIKINCWDYCSCMLCFLHSCKDCAASWGCESQMLFHVLVFRISIALSTLCLHSPTLCLLIQVTCSHLWHWNTASQCEAEQEKKRLHQATEVSSWHISYSFQNTQLTPVGSVENLGSIFNDGFISIFFQTGKKKRTPSPTRRDTSIQDKLSLNWAQRVIKVSLVCLHICNAENDVFYFFVWF